MADDCRGDNQVEAKGGPIAYTLANETAVFVGGVVDAGSTPDSVQIQVTGEGGAASTVVANFALPMGAALSAQAYSPARTPGAAEEGDPLIGVVVTTAAGATDQCDNGIGRFTVRAIEFEEDTLTRFAAEFALSCTDTFDSASALRGCVSYTAE